VFVSGDSYAKDGFSTRTTLLDTATGASIANLEDFAVTRDGRAFKAVDFNFWGVTFQRDGRRFYATLRTGGTNYLIEGDVDSREARVIHTGIECPSLSPDGRQIAFKQRAARGSEVSWHVAVLDLATLRETTLDWEQRSVDDQVEWLDDTHVLYHWSGPEGNNIWALRTDRPEPPRILIHGAWSPAVVR
jgi:dipeptidyl aminopeptidase/acylaminoacyl peptidase